jgi:hypothetical protein
MPNPFTVSGTNDSFTFNGPVREIEVGVASSEFNVQYVYSFWKQWVNEGEAQYLPAFRPVGGDDLGGGNSVAFYAFLSNGWRVRIPDGLDNLIVTSGILATDELDNPFKFDGVLITLQQPLAVQFVENPDVAALEARMSTIESQQADTIIPNQVSIAATADKTYNKLVSVGNTVDSIYTNVVGINNVVVDTNNRVVSIGATTLDIKKNTNLIPALL